MDDKICPVGRLHPEHSWVQGHAGILLDSDDVKIVVRVYECRDCEARVFVDNDR